jgi:hypothetical protein
VPVNVIPFAASGTVIVLESVRLPVILEITDVVPSVPLNPVKLRLIGFTVVVMMMESDPAVTLKFAAAVDAAFVLMVRVVPVEGFPVRLKFVVPVNAPVDPVILNTVPLRPVILTTPVVPKTSVPL